MDSIHPHWIATVLLFAACCGPMDEGSDTPGAGQGRHATGAGGLLHDALVDNCHTFITGLNPTRYGPRRGRCTQREPRVVSVTHEDENLTAGNMFGLHAPPPGMTPRHRGM